jgi:hypothetical protein
MCLRTLTRVRDSLTTAVGRYSVPLLCSEVFAEVACSHSLRQWRYDSNSQSDREWLLCECRLLLLLLCMVLCVHFLHVYVVVHVCVYVVVHMCVCM